MDSVLPQILLQVSLILLNAIFACAEIAVLSFNEMKLEQMSTSGNKKAKRLLKLTNQPAKFLATIQVAITLSGFLGSAFAADSFSEILVELIAPVVGNTISVSVLDKISVVIITLVLSYFTLVFGELVPKRLAMKKSEQLALALSGIISFISVAFAPIVWFLTKSTNGILHLFGIDPNEKDEGVTEEEIKLMVGAGSEIGTIDENEKELIENVFEFDDLSADELATKRTELTVLRLQDSVEEWDRIICEDRFTRYPICDGDIDHVVAVLNTKYYFRLKDKSRENVMKSSTRAPYFVPETVKADVLFKNMKKNNDFFAIVLDEYGGVNGIITMTDLLECIVGDLDAGDGGDPDAEEIANIGENEWQILGSASIKDVSDALGVNLDDEICDTFAGYVLSLLGAIPEDGSRPVIETDELLIKITDVREHRIESAEVTLKQNKASDQPEE